MCDGAERLVCGTRTNLFLIRDNQIMTPALDRCGVGGIMRRQILEGLSGNQIDCSVMDIPAAALEDADEVFVCNSQIGVLPVPALRNAELAGRRGNTIDYGDDGLQRRTGVRSLKKILIALGVVVLIGGLGAGLAFSHVSRVLDTPLTVPEDGVPFEIPPGSAFTEVSGRLEAEGLFSDAQILTLYARWTGDANSIQAGEYLIEQGTTPRELLDVFTSGAVRLYSFTIVEGWNHRELLAVLQEHPEIVAEMSADDWPALLADLGAEETWPEGLFLPETYRFPGGTTDRELLGEAYGLMQSTLDELWESRTEMSPVESPYEALILASIVEKETARADERQRIAGVFARRLDRRMRLQTDPTVIYGIGPDFNGNLTRRDLRTDTPYNTYTRHGLPPTPIAMPGRAAIEAALDPADGEELYFVATGLGDGSHQFSVTNEEHEAAVQEYLRRLRENR